MLWPAGLDEQENLIVAHDKMFVESLVEIQRWVPCLQYNNTQLFRACSRFYVCGLNVMEQPVSQTPLRSIANTIQRLWVIDKVDPTTHLESASAPDDWCSRIEYHQVEYCEILKYQQRVAGCSTCGGFANFSGIFGYPACDCQKGDYPVPDDAEYLSSPGLPMGHHYQPQASTDSTRRYPRAKRGVWALHNGRIYVAPWLQSTETVVVEWNGIKNLWDDVDLVENSAQLKRTVRYYLAWNQAKDYDRDTMAAANAERDYRDALRWMMRDCREENAVRRCGGGTGDNNGSASGSGGGSRMADIPLASQGGPAGQVEPVKATLQQEVQEVAQCPDVEQPGIYPPFNAIVTYPIRVVLTVVTPGSVIHYTTDGTTPTLASPTYTGPFDLQAGKDVYAIAFLGQCPSEAAMSLYRDASDPDIVGPDGLAPVLTTLCTTTDRAGQWGVFNPNGKPDINWKLNFKFADGSIIKRLELYETDAVGEWTTGRAWATKLVIQGSFQSYPVVIDNAVGQINLAYTDNLNQVGSVEQDWFLFGEEAGVPASGSYYRLEIILANGDIFYGHSTITCEPPPPPATSYNCVSGNCVDPGTGEGNYDTLAECQAAGCNPCTVEITASDYTTTVDGEPDCECVTVDLAAQVSVTGGVLTGFTLEGGGSYAADATPCLANPGTYQFTAYAVSNDGLCYDNTTFMVTLNCNTAPPCEPALPLLLQVGMSLYNAFVTGTIYVSWVNDFQYYGTGVLTDGEITPSHPDPTDLPTTVTLNRDGLVWGITVTIDSPDRCSGFTAIIGTYAVCEPPLNNPPIELDVCGPPDQTAVVNSILLG